MSTLIDLLPPVFGDQEQECPAVPDQASIQVEEPALAARPVDWSPKGFAEEQIRGLVRQLFLPGWLHPSRQVVFLPVDGETEITDICMRVGQSLADLGSGITCVVQTKSVMQNTGHVSPTSRSDPASPQKRFGALRDSSQQLSDRLWFMPEDTFLSGSEKGLSPPYLRARLAELRLEFDYTILSGPAAVHGEAALLAGLCDGAVLVLKAHSTRRVAARRVQERLRAAKVRLLGVVLSERRFPVPEAIYRRA